MSRLSVARKPLTPLAQVAENLRNAITQRGQDFASADHTRAMIGLEGLDEATFTNINRHAQELRNELRREFATAFGLEGNGEEALKDYTEAQWEAGAITAMAAGAPLEYHRTANEMKRSISTENLRVIEPNTVGTYGDPGFMDKSVAMEAFDEKELKAHMAYSIAFNVNAARQDEFGEAFYPTVVVSPDQAGLDVSIRRPMVMNEVRHLVTGKVMDFQRKNLIDAVVEPTILATESTRNVPVRLTAGPDAAANQANFLTATAYNKTLEDGTVIATAGLLPGRQVDLLGLGQRDDLATTGQYDVTDSLDTRLYLEKLYIAIAGATATVPTSTFAFDVSRLPRNGFIKSHEGRDRESYLAFTTVDLPISSLTEDITGALPAASSLEYLTGVGRTNWVVRLGIQVNGDADHEQGNIRVTGTSITIEGGFDKVTGVALTTAEVTALRAEFTGSLAAYEVYSARTNLNRRTRGLQVTSLEITERYTIPLLSPINALAPISSNRDASDLTTLITAARIRNSNLAVGQLLNYNDTLASYALSQDRLLPVPTIEGIGRLLVRPYHEADTLDAFDVTASVKSQDRAADVSAAIINAIRAKVYKMYTESGYQAAADALSGTIGEKPMVIIGTDPVTAKHINITGDTRTMGFHFESRIVTSLDKRVRNKIFITFVRPNQAGAGVDPLSFGVMAWMPELAGTVQLTRNGATVKETMVQPRVRHINLLPCLITLTISNLAEAVADQLPVRTDEI